MSEIFRYAHVDGNGLIVNVSLWDGVTVFDPGEGVVLVEVGDAPCGPGWSYVDGEFVAPPEPVDDIIEEDV